MDLLCEIHPVSTNKTLISSHGHSQHRPGPRSSK